jgi:hypothetical protein
MMVLIEAPGCVPWHIACLSGGYASHPVLGCSAQVPHFAVIPAEWTVHPAARPDTKSRSAMQIKLSLRQAVLSSLIFGGVLLALASVDARVRERVGDVVSGSDGLSPWGDRLSDLGGALASAIRHQSLENAPLLVFAAVGAVLFVFMVRT